VKAAAETYRMLFKLASQSAEIGLVKEALGEAALRRLAIGLGLGGAGVAGAGIPLAYSAGKSKAERAAEKSRPLVFGAGLAGGIALPALLKALKASVSGARLGTGFEPGFTGI